METLSKKWCERFLHLAKIISTWSKDESSKVGAIIVNSDGHIKSTGFNGFPRGVNEEKFSIRNERPLKYNFTEHAERNAIYLAHQDIRDHVMFITAFPCPDCTRGIIQSGISTIVVDKDYMNNLSENTSLDPKRFPEKYNSSRDMLNEARVEIIENYRGNTCD